MKSISLRMTDEEKKILISSSNKKRMSLNSYILLKLFGEVGNKDNKDYLDINKENENTNNKIKATTLFMS